MSDLRELYQEVILDHSRRPRNCQALEHPDRRAEGFNPLCGDKVVVYLELDGDRIQTLAFQGSGCAISTASASLMTEILRGKTVDEALHIFEQFHHLLTEDGDAADEDLGKLTVFAGVKEFPSRVKCATLAWHTLHAALENTRAMANSEGDEP